MEKSVFEEVETDYRIGIKRMWTEMSLGGLERSISSHLGFGLGDNQDYRKLGGCPIEKSSMISDKPWGNYSKSAAEINNDSSPYKRFTDTGEVFQFKCWRGC